MLFLPRAEARSYYSTRVLTSVIHDLKGGARVTPPFKAEENMTSI